MTFLTPSLLSTVVFVLIVAVVLAAILGGIYWSNRGRGRLTLWRVGGVALGLFFWLGLVAGLTISGVTSHNPPRALMILFGLSNLFALALGCSTVGRWLASLPLSALVAFQGFRFPLELVLHSWVEQGSIPQTMTWTGLNWDIVTGLVSIGAAPFVSRGGRLLAWVVNGLGFLLLLNVMRVAVLSSPFPFGWGVTPPLLLGLHFPYVWIVPVCVSGALLGHVVLTRALMRPS